jgi:hypothetical protein
MVIVNPTGSVITQSIGGLVFHCCHIAAKSDSIGARQAFALRRGWPIGGS